KESSGYPFWLESEWPGTLFTTLLQSDAKPRKRYEKPWPNHGQKSSSIFDKQTKRTLDGVLRTCSASFRRSRMKKTPGLLSNLPEIACQRIGKSPILSAAIPTLFRRGESRKTMQKNCGRN